MKYTRSIDGVMRATVRVNIRFELHEVEQIREYLRRNGKMTRDCDVKKFVEDCTDYCPGSALDEINNW